MYTCGWFMVIYGRNQHNILTTLQFKIIFFFKKACRWEDNTCTKTWRRRRNQSKGRKKSRSLWSRQREELVQRSWIWVNLGCKTEKATASHSSTLAWKIPWAEEPGRLQSMGLLRVRHNWVTSLSLFTFTRWRRKWQPTPVFLPGESPGRGSLVGCHLWGHTESDTTEET